MLVDLYDAQVVGETEAQLFQVKGVTEFLLHLKNSGVNIMAYRVQEYNGSSWVDLGSSGDDYYNTLTADQTRMFKVSATYPQVRIVGNASGGSYLDVAIKAYVNRASGGAFTIMPT